MAGSLYDLGQALFKAGDSAASLEHHQQAFEMRCILYGKRPHVEVWESLHSMGSACCKVGRCLDSVKYHGQALEMGRLLPVSLAYSLQQVADNFYGFGLYEEAVEVYKELLQILEEGGLKSS
ncbi:MAG: tetratricopeptide repeat protein [Rhabdochlamydiaceae bacterium]